MAAGAATGTATGNRVTGATAAGAIGTAAPEDIGPVAAGARGVVARGGATGRATGTAWTSCHCRSATAAFFVLAEPTLSTAQRTVRARNRRSRSPEALVRTVTRDPSLKVTVPETSRRVFPAPLMRSRSILTGRVTDHRTHLPLARPRVVQTAPFTGFGLPSVVFDTSRAPVPVEYRAVGDEEDGAVGVACALSTGARPASASSTTRTTAAAGRNRRAPAVIACSPKTLMSHRN